MGNHTQTVCFFLEASRLSLGARTATRFRDSKQGVHRRLVDVDLQLAQGQLAILLGPNGAGKSTLLSALAGRLLVEAGEISLRQHPGDNHLPAKVVISRQADNLRQWNRHIGYMPETIPLLPRLTVRETLGNALYLKIGQVDDEAIARVINRCDLTAYADRPVETLSLGYRQRLGLACALVHEPLVLLLDEPMNGLDPEHAQAFGRILASLKRRHIILLSTHLLDQLHGLADHIFVMRGGRLLGDLASGASCDDALDTPLTGRHNDDLLPRGESATLRPWRLRFDRPVSELVKKRVGERCSILAEETQLLVVGSDDRLNRQLIQALAGEGLCELAPVEQETSIPDKHKDTVTSLLAAYQELLQQDIVAHEEKNRPRPGGQGKIAGGSDSLTNFSNENTSRHNS